MFSSLNSSLFLNGRRDSNPGPNLLKKISNVTLCYTHFKPFDWIICLWGHVQKKCANYGLLLYIFVPFNNKFTENCRLQQDSNSDRRSRKQASWPLYHHRDPEMLKITFPRIRDLKNLNFLTGHFRLLLFFHLTFWLSKNFFFGRFLKNVFFKKVLL